MQYEIKGPHDRFGITFVYVTHDQHEALVMSDRIVVMEHGRIAQVGTPTEIYDRPANRFVASFIGESNFLDVTFQGRDGRTLLLCQGASVLRAAGEDPPNRADVMVRPEKIALLLQHPGEDPARNVLPATVRQAILIGETRRYLLQTEQGTQVIVKQQHRFGATDRTPGDPVLLSWAVADTLLI